MMMWRAGVMLVTAVNRMAAPRNQRIAFLWAIGIAATFVGMLAAGALSLNTKKNVEPTLEEIDPFKPHPQAQSGLPPGFVLDTPPEQRASPGREPERAPSGNPFDQFDTPKHTAPGEWATVENAEYGFRFSYPKNWSLGTGPALGQSNTPVIISWNKSPGAICAIGIVSQPSSTTQSQASLDQSLLANPISAEIWRKISGQGCSQYRLRSSSLCTVGRLPAYQALTECYITPIASQSDPLGILGSYHVDITLVTLTPGLSWRLSCSGDGLSLEEADGSYNYWRPTFERIIQSFIFTR
jgi:hypothetical protein